MKLHGEWRLKMKFQEDKKLIKCIHWMRGLFYDGSGYMLNLGIIEYLESWRRHLFLSILLTALNAPQVGSDWINISAQIFFWYSHHYLKKNARRGPRLKVLVIEVLFVVQTGIMSQISLPV